MANRKKHKKTEYEKARKDYREVSSRHVVQFETDMTENQKRRAFAIADMLRRFGNQVKHTMAIRLEQMKRTKAYRNLMTEYGKCAEQMSKAAPDSEEYIALESKKKTIGKQMSKMQKQFGVTWEDVRREMMRVSQDKNVNSVFCLREAEAVWQGVDRILYSDGKRLHFRRRGGLPCIKAKQSNRGIPIHAVNGELKFSVDRIGEFGILIPKNDLFLQEEAANILNFMSNAKLIEQQVVYCHQENGVCLDTWRPCYAVLKCMEIRGRLRVYVQITVEAVAAPKRKKDGSFRHDFSAKGIVGCDIGPQSVAAVSDNTVMLDNLAERDHRSTKQYEAKERKLRRRWIAPAGQ